ncbi:MAG: MJ0042-type zinc finger domain-containing protein, partial [Noviherbaspirillum sp.]
MALATQCPHCHTTFRVAHDQLKLRAGLVRCGACKQIFNGIENLLRSEEAEQVNTPASLPQAASTTESTPSATINNDAVQASFSPPADGVADDTPSIALPPEQVIEENNTLEAFVPPASSRDAASDDPLLRMTLMDFTHAPSEQDEDKSANALPDEPLDTDRLE